MSVNDQTAELRAAKPLSAKLQVAAPRLGLMIAGLCLLVLVRAIWRLDKLDTGFSDNLMRLVEVRDWLAGQGWFDVMQYRLLPPEGVSMHWSRYVDAGIAALLVPLSWVLPMAQAEAVTMVLWPSLLLMLLLVVVMRGSDRLFGPLAAFAAGLVAVFWAKLGAGKFSPGALDHHNLQLLFSTAALMLTVAPARDPGLGAARHGAAAALATAFALAVGLEMLPVLLLLWGMAAVRFALRRAGAASWLTGYALVIAVAAPLLMIGQTPYSEWFVAWCDELAPPVLTLIWAGVAASLAGVALGRRLPGFAARMAVMAAVAGFGLWLASPMLQACLAGPYGAMPEEAERIITERIAEAQPAWQSFAVLPFGVNALVTPALAVVLLAGILAWQARRVLTRAEGEALVMALVVGAVGLAFSMVQIRALAVAAPAIPLLAGFVMVRIVALIQAGHRRAGGLCAALALVFVFLPEAPLIAVKLALQPAQAAPDVPLDPDAWQPLAGSCRTPETLAELRGLATEFPKESVVMTELNFGAMILAHTPYGATSAGYHRSGDAFLHGVLPFQREDRMIAGLRKSGSDYVLICAPGGGGGSWGKALVEGARPVWLKEVDDARGELLVLRVDPVALEAAWEALPEAVRAGLWQ